jgi:hypothetical protein
MLTDKPRDTGRLASTLPDGMPHDQTNQAAYHTTRRTRRHTPYHKYVHALQKGRSYSLVTALFIVLSMGFASATDRYQWCRFQSWGFVFCLSDGSLKYTRSLSAQLSVFCTNGRLRGSNCPQGDTMGKEKEERGKKERKNDER